MLASDILQRAADRLRKPGALTESQKRALWWLCWGIEHFDGFYTGRRTRRSTVLSLVQLGLASDAGLLLVRSDDYPDRERYRHGFRPTVEGVAMCLQIGDIDESTAKRLTEKLATYPEVVAALESAAALARGEEGKP